MKTCFCGLFCCLLTLFTKVADAQPTITSSSYSGEMDSRFPLVVTFDETVIGRQHVDTDVSPDFLRVDPALPFTAKWSSPNTISVNFEEDVPYRALYTWKVAPGSQYLSGVPIPETIGQTHGSLFKRFDLTSTKNRGTLPIVYVFSYDPISPEDFEPPGFKDNESGKVIPARPLTFTMAHADELIKQDWQLAKSFTSWKERQKDKEFSPENPITNIIAFTPETPLVYEHTYTFSIENSKLSVATENVPEPKDCTITCPESFEVDSHLGCTNDGKQLQIRLTAPISTDNLASIFRDNINISANEEMATNDPGGWSKTAFVEGEKIEFVLDTEALGSSIETSVIPILVRGNAVFSCEIVVKDLVALDQSRLEDNVGEAGCYVYPDLPTLELDVNNSIMLPSGTRSFQTRFHNADKVSVQAKKLPASFEAQAMFNYHGIRKSRYNDRENPDKVFDSQFSFNQAPFEKLSSKWEITSKLLHDTFPVSLDQLFEERLSPGMYLVQAKAHPRPLTAVALKERMVDKELIASNEMENQSLSLIQITDLGMMWKLSKDGTITIYAYHLSTGNAVQDGLAQLMDGNGQVLAEGKINQSMVALLIPKGTEIIRISSGNDSFTQPFEYSGSMDSSSSDPFSDYYSNDNDDFLFVDTKGIKKLPYDLERTGIDIDQYDLRQVYMFTDRGMYQPGETGHIKGFVRNLRGNAIGMPTQKNAVFSIFKDGKDLISTQTITLSPQGGFDVEFRIPNGDPSTYRGLLYFPTRIKSSTSFDEEQKALANDPPINLERDQKFNREFSLNIPVRDFKRDNFDIKTDMVPPKPGRKRVEFSTTATNYTGIPLSNAKVNWYLNASPTDFTPEGYADYEFGQDLNRIYERPSQTMMLDQKGQAQSHFLLKNNDPTPLALRLITSVDHPGDNVVFKSTKGRLDPARVYVGIKRNPRWLSLGRIALDLIAIRPDGKVYNKDLPVTIEVTRKSLGKSLPDNSSSFPEKGMDRFKIDLPNLDRQYSVFSSTTIIPAKRTPRDHRVNIPATQPGIYTVSITGKDDQGNDFKSSTTYQVYGTGSSPWLYDEASELELKTDKPLYKNGDTARIILPFPMEGDVGITLERGHVLRSMVTRVNLKDQYVEVPIKAEDAPNVYASVFLVKGAVDRGRIAGNPHLLMGYCNLRVDPAQHRLNVTFAQPREVTLPGSEQEISGTVTDFKGKPVQGAEVTLYVEDEGTLAYTQYSNPQCLDHFYSDRYWKIKNFSPLARLLPENMADRRFWGDPFCFDTKSEGNSFGSNFQEISGKLPLRRNFNPCAFWKADIKTDDKGNFRVNFTNPDTLTRYRIIAVAADEARFGTGTTSYTVSKPVMAEPSILMFASQNDKLNLALTVSKSTPRSGKWMVLLSSSTPDIVRIEQDSCLVEIPAIGTTTISLPVTFTGTGDARLEWSLLPVNAEGKLLPENELQALSDRVESRFPVIFPAPLLRERHSFILEGDTAWDPAQALAPEIQSAKGSLVMEASTSPMVAVSDNIQFLLKYPYGCLEQKSSAMVPWLCADIFSKYCPSFPAYTPEKRKRVLQQTINTLLKSQNADGTLPYWQKEKGNCVFSPYAAIIMLLLQQEGFDIPEAAMNKLLKSLEKLPHADCRPMATWAQAKGNFFDKSDFDALLKNSGKAASRSDALLEILALSESTEEAHRNAAIELLAHLPSQEKNTITGSIAPALELLARSALQPTEPETLQSFEKLLQPYLAQQRLNTTWQNGWDLIAMGQFLKTAPAPTQDVILGWKNLPPNTAASVPADGKSVSQTISLPNKETGSLAVSGSGRAYIHIQAEGKPEQIDFPGVTDKGMRVTRIYEVRKDDGTWQAASKFRLGDIVRISLTVTADQAGCRYLAIEDNMPAAFEVIPPDIAGELRASFYLFPTCISNRELSKSQVRFFVNNLEQPGSFQAFYLARVVQTGEVTAPPAKAELMYEPQVYGLSLSERLSITPRKEEK